MRRLTALAAFATAAGLAFAAVPVAAQTPPPAQAAAPSRGVTADEVKTWLVGLGGDINGPIPIDGGLLLHVQDSARPWSLSLFGCRERCDDLQYSAVFTGPVTEAQITAWNRESRYLKGVWIAPTTPGGDATVLARYDVLLLADGAEQLQEPTYVWLQFLTRFHQAISAGPTPAPAPAR